jgi:hypothetical protein
MSSDQHTKGAVRRLCQHTPVRTLTRHAPCYVNTDTPRLTNTVQVDRFENVEKLMGMCSDGLTREFTGIYVKDSVGRVHCGFKCLDAPGQQPRLLLLVFALDCRFDDDGPVTLRVPCRACLS